ncbi:MAG: hypothetical protein KGZ34_09435 [Nitrosarchaeum sp.]|nr:hypothetical protein [Nitrosarchaeum sp.]HSA76988.1 hypothetical protein [Nitrosarchaeum sp.]
MAKRTTIMLEDDIIKKIRIIQANMIKHSVESVSFSSVVNQILQKALK